MKIIEDSISVDCSAFGKYNNGIKFEYKGVNTKTGEVLFASKVYECGTVNIGEFLAIVHALAYCKMKNIDVPIYSDSMTALSWLRRKKIKTTLPKNNPEIFKIIERALHWLKSNDYKNPVLKWETGLWGENPADYSRKNKKLKK